MDYYIDIKIKPDAEMRENVLLNKVYSKLHKTLFSLKSTSIGVSFPKYNVMLGDVIRIHASQEKLDDLQKSDWLGGLIGYCDLTQPLSVPADVSYRTVSRKQTNMSQAKLNRLLKRGTIKQEEVKNYRAKMFQQGIDNPYLELESGSNGHKHRRYIAFSTMSNEPVTGSFDQFGLSKEATIPWF